MLYPVNNIVPMTTQSKIVKISTLRRKLTALRRDGKVIAFTNGCFDILHYGHVNYLESAKKFNRVLIVGLNSDASIRRIKGPQRPINTQANRAGVLAGLACVDFVILFEEDTPYELIRSLRPDVLIKGADWKDKGIVGADIVRASGGRIEFIEFVPELSTTNTIQTIVRQC